MVSYGNCMLFSVTQKRHFRKSRRELLSEKYEALAVTGLKSELRERMRESLSGPLGEGRKLYEYTSEIAAAARKRGGKNAISPAGNARMSLSG